MSCSGSKGVAFIIFLVLHFLFALGLNELNFTPHGAEMVPMMMTMGRRKLLAGSFQICAMCTCCGGAGAKGRYCMPSPCCYSISCNIPNRPFGFCAFTPKTCNCLRCHL